jgi:hypothetical protein
MPPPKKRAHVKRLAKSIRENQSRPGARRARTSNVRAQSRGDARGTVGDERDVSALARFMGALQKEGIRFQIIGMSAAILQGVPGSTLDVDLWVDLPSREYMKTTKVALREGAEVVRNTVVALSDQTLVNFVYKVTGLGSFDSEFRRSTKLNFHGVEVPVLQLESIGKSKRAVGRPKDLIHVQQIEQFLSCKSAENRSKPRKKTR